MKIPKLKSIVDVIKKTIEDMSVPVDPAPTTFSSIYHLKKMFQSIFNLFK